MVRMAGLIVRKDIDLVRERTDLKAVVEEFVTLRSAGVGSFKGLCPFHDERTPSFHVRPGVGTYHCFGCGAHGDVISFLMELEHTTFTETVERLASRVGVELHYEDGGTGPDKAETGRRRRLFEANKVADEFFRRALGSPGPGRPRLPHPAGIHTGARGAVRPIRARSAVCRARSAATATRCSD